MINIKSPLLTGLLVTPLILSGCGGSGGSDGDETGSLSVGITDGPVDSANLVMVSFSGLSIKPVDGEVIEFNFDTPKEIDLLQLQGNNAEALITDETVPAGEYEWIRLHVNAEDDGVLDSYIELGDGTTLELRIPSGSQTGLKLVSGFTVAAGSLADFTIDFDLRKSVTNPEGQPAAILKPALRLIDNIQTGIVSGTVSGDIVAANCADSSVNDGAVYLYTGADVMPQDVQGNEGDPLASALVEFVEGEYRYELGFVAEGDYTITYTCDNVEDDPEAADELVFTGTGNTSVTADEETTFNFE